MATIGQNWAQLQKRLAAAAASSGRSSEEITVVAVSKTRSAAEISAALACGLTILGENRVQEADAKKEQVEGAAQWHLIGALQTNKARRAVALFDVIQSVDRQRLARVLDRCAGETGRILDILIQVNTSQEPNKAGIAPAALDQLVDEVVQLSNLRLRGLMTIGPLGGSPEQNRACFRQLRTLADGLSGQGLDMRYLSMGMSGDFEMAIAEGANMVRLGTALFGPRPA